MSDIFSPSKLRKAVHASLDDATAALPPGKRGAVLIDATQDRVRALLVFKAGDAWTVAAEAQYDGEAVAGKVAVAGSWK